MAVTPQPFSPRVPQADIDDLRLRLARTRYPDQAPGAPWAFGTDVTYLRNLVDYWCTAFDWRAQEARLNSFPQFKVPLKGIDLHRTKSTASEPLSAAAMTHERHQWRRGCSAEHRAAETVTC